MQVINKKPILRLELINSLLHFAAGCFGVIFIFYLLFIALKTTNNIFTFATIYGLAYLMVFTISSFYYGVLQLKVKHFFKISYQTSIYSITGTYTSLVAIFVNTAFRVALLVALWTLTILGSLFKLFFTRKFEILLTIIYILMGLLLLISGKLFFISIPTTITTLIITGAGLYCIGVIFYLRRRHTCHHAIWHLFLKVAICH